MVFAKVKSFTFSVLRPNPVKNNVFLNFLERNAELFTRFSAFNFGLKLCRFFDFSSHSCPTACTQPQVLLFGSGLDQISHEKGFGALETGHKTQLWCLFGLL